MADERATCPACQSVISADGRTLFERSAHLTDAEESAGLLEKAMARIEELETRLVELEKKPEPAAEPEPKKQKKGGRRGVVEREEREGKPEGWSGW